MGSQKIQRATHPEELPFIDDEPRYHDGYHIRPKPRQRVYAVMGEWSPDWSQAPEWADAWRTTECGQAWWSRGDWWTNFFGGWSASGFGHRAEKAPSFGFAGDWKQSECRRYLQHVILEQTVSA